MKMDREFDIIVWGASGFTGRLVAEYLFNRYGSNETVKWAMAGRNEAKLERVRTAVADDTIPLVVADSHDEASLNAMAQRTKVICTTVGPYGKYGSKLVAACVANQTHYCDLAGEVAWMRAMIDQHHETAQANDTKIVHTCGFDSIPSDMGVFFMQKEAMARTGAPAKQIHMRVKAFAGEMSGGTYASLNDTMEKVAQDKSLYDVLLNPYSLNPEGERSGPDKRDLQSVIYDQASQSWIYPFIMAGINTKVVRRSNALGDYPYGKDFLYDEAVMSGDGFMGRLKGIQAAMMLGVVMLARPGSLLKKGLDRILPKPGEGPNKAKREAGFYNLRFYATLADGSAMMGKVTGDMDPGYGSTAKMMAECAVCLAQDEIPDVAGVLTPSIAMGEPLLERLQTNAGLTFSCEA
ncbi:MAG: saccharopine dehydrogenase NADP-binding domain-containing protein [Chloroflexota bacterium]